MNEHIYNSKRGLKDGIPIGLGYLAVSFTFGIMAKGAGLTTLEAVVLSLTNLTSAGQFAGLGIITAGSSLLEMALAQLIINLRYCLMSCSLSQKLDSHMPFFHRSSYVLWYEQTKFLVYLYAKAGFLALISATVLWLWQFLAGPLEHSLVLFPEAFLPAMAVKCIKCSSLWNVFSSDHPAGKRKESTAHGYPYFHGTKLSLYFDPGFKGYFLRL